MFLTSHTPFHGRSFVCWTKQVCAQKLDEQARQRRDAGEEVHAIDFEQLKIENQQLLAQTAKHSRDMLALKHKTGFAMQVCLQ